MNNYNDYINKSFSYLDSTVMCDKKELSNKLLQIYSENKYNFKLKEISIGFTKYSAIENKLYNKYELNSIGLYQYRYIYK